MSINVHVLFIGIVLMTVMVVTDSLNMNAYAKKINGNNDDNTLKGTPNDDRLKGKDGDDVFHGYSGADYFDCGKGKDTIKDFSPSEGDKKSSGCEKVNHKGKNHDDDGKSDNSDGSNSAGQGISQGQSSKQRSQCVAGANMGTSCNNIGAQNLANTGNSASGQQGGSEKNDKAGNSAGQGISQGQSSKQRSQCVAGANMGTSCNNIGAQNLANTGNSASGQQGGSGGNSGDGENSAGQGISQGQSSKQRSQCVAGGSIDASCMNISVQNQANTGNSAAAQDGGSGGNSGDGENAAGQGISQGQSSDQESQCVSGKDAIVSCDNVAFQNMVNSGKNALGQTR